MESINSLFVSNYSLFIKKRLKSGCPALHGIRSDLQALKFASLIFFLTFGCKTHIFVRRVKGIILTIPE